MADERKAARGRSRMRQWARRLAGMVLLGGVIALAFWFGMDQPHFWRMAFPVRPAQEAEVVSREPLPTTEVIIDEAITAVVTTDVTTNVVTPPTPFATPDASLFVSDNSTFTSR